MRWFSRRKAISLTRPPASQAQKEAVSAAKAATRRLQETQAKWPEITDRAEALARIRRENHFAEMIRSAIIGEGS